jgi:hypothetical protein
MEVKDSEVGKELVARLVEWQTRTRALFVTMRELASHFGPRTAAESLGRALEAPGWLVERIAYPQPTLVGMPGPQGKFRTRSKRLAGILSPLVQLVGGPVPPFVELARALPNGMPTLLTFAEFSGRFGVDVACPLFEAHPEFAREDWLRLNAVRLRGRRVRT